MSSSANVLQFSPPTPRISQTPSPRGVRFVTLGLESPEAFSVTGGGGGRGTNLGARSALGQKRQRRPESWTGVARTRQDVSGDPVLE